VLARARGNRGTLVASGFIAGGALAGVLDGLLKFAGEEFLGRSLTPRLDFDGPGGNWLGLLVFALLAAWVYRSAGRATPEEGAGPELTM
jgi:hypothetical protein